MKTRQQLIARIRQQRDEIAQYFTDVAHWNATRGKAEGCPVPVDPDGAMAKIIKSYDEVLSRELPGYTPEPLATNTPAAD